MNSRRFKDDCIAYMGGLSDNATDITFEPRCLPIDATDAAFRPLLNIPVTKRMMYVNRRSPKPT